MPAHAAPLDKTRFDNALAYTTLWEPSAISDEEEPYYKEVLWHMEQGFQSSTTAAKAAWEHVKFTRFMHNSEPHMIEAAEHAYAALVVQASYLQARMDEWAIPTQWTDGEVDNDGYVTIYNAGSEELRNFQSNDVDYVKIDEHGIGVKDPYNV